MDRHPGDGDFLWMIPGSGLRGPTDPTVVDNIGRPGLPLLEVQRNDLVADTGEIGFPGTFTICAISESHNVFPHVPTPLTDRPKG